MRRLFQTILRVLAMLAVAPVLASAQTQIDPAFSDSLIRDFGYPEVTVEVGPEGVIAPTELPAELHLVTLVADEPLLGYVNIMQQPPGLSEEEATRLALDAAANDLIQPDWVYLGGATTPNPGRTPPSSSTSNRGSSSGSRQATVKAGRTRSCTSSR